MEQNMTGRTTGAQSPLPNSEASETAVADVHFEHARDAVGIGTPSPRLSWIVTTPAEAWYQAAYAIEARAPDGERREESGRIESDQSVLVPWPFAPLSSRERRLVRVMVWGIDGVPSAWSAPYPVEAGLLDADDWSARFVAPAWDEDISSAQPGPLLRRDFQVRTNVASARLYVTAFGVYEMHLNGSVVGDHVLAPGWTSYNHRLRYQTFDVTDLLHEGPNALGAMLGDGWYRGRLGFAGGRRNIYGDRLALLAQLEVTYTNGATERIVSDENWRAVLGPILASDIYDGETYDARLERDGWAAAGYDDHGWSAVRRLDRDLATLVAPAGPPVRRIDVIAPLSITISPAGRTLVDFGQNLVGWIRLTVSGPAGQMITLRHAEVLEDGELCTRPLRTARATDRYTLRGDKQETWEPRFTFHGFRYVEVQGWPGTLHPDDIRAVVCHSDLERTGWFDSSDPLLNRLHENVVWSMRGNFLDIPTDCPQRDERIGWTGDIQVFAPTACFLYDCAGFLASWLADLAAEQQDAGGAVPHIVPSVMEGPFPSGAAAWGDAAVIVPWVLYQRFGDAGILATQFESMRAWVDCVAERAGKTHLWDRGFQFGDWLDPSAPPDNAGAARTDPSLVATAYFAHSAQLLARAAGVLGRAEDELRYLSLAAQVRDAFNAEYVSPTGRVVSDATTAYALALEFDLLHDAEQRRHAGARLATLVREGGHRISTGFVGTPLICDALCNVGAYDVAFRLLTQRACPSWLYPVTMGATTIWERWDSLRPDGTVNTGEMTSFNHYALGAIADWLHRTVAGIAPAAPGYRRVEIRPYPGGGITYARACLRTPYGLTTCEWRITMGTIAIEVVVAPNTTARVTLPESNAEPIEVGSGTHRWSYEYPSGVRPRLTLNSTLDELIDDAEAWSAALVAVPGLARFEISSQWRSGMLVRHVLSLVPNAAEAHETLTATLASLRRLDV
jgi:alpha-L-rhamnosidase